MCLLLFCFVLFAHTCSREGTTLIAGAVCTIISTHVGTVFIHNHHRSCSALLLFGEQRFCNHNLNSLMYLGNPHSHVYTVRKS